MPLFSAYLLVAAGVLGLVIGSFLNVVAYRVPAGISLLRESRCPNCSSPVRPWHNVPVVSWIALRGKCASCGQEISARYPLIEALTGFTFAAITGLFLANSVGSGGGLLSAADIWASGLILVAYLYFAAICIVLALIDLDTRRLPNKIVLPSYVVALILLGLATWIGSDWHSLLRAGAGMVSLYTFYFLLRLVRPGGMGGGDVKLAGVVGIYLGWIGWGALFVGAFAAFVYGGLFGIALMVVKRAGRKTAIPFGPWIILGAWTGVFAGEAVGRWYVNLFAGA